MEVVCPRSTQAESGLVEPIVYRAKPIAMFVQGMWVQIGLSYDNK